MDEEGVDLAIDAAQIDTGVVAWIAIGDRADRLSTDTAQGVDVALCLVLL